MNKNIKSGIITGGTSGIGLALAKLLADRDYNLVIFGHSKKRLEEALDAIDSQNVRGLQADVSNFEQLSKIFDFFESKFSHLDFLVNNASLPGRSILDHNAIMIQKVINVNLAGYLFASKLALERMKKQGCGHIINIGSLSARTRDAGTDVYSAAKVAVEGFSDSIRREVNDYGIKVTLIEPGGTSTGMITESEEERVQLENEQLLLIATDVAEAVKFCLEQDDRVEITNLALKAKRQII